MNQISTSTIYRNIKFEAKRKQVKIGELEEKAGVSPGYFSRLSGKDDKNSAIDIIMKVADILNISLELLLTVKLEDKTPTERLVLDFINRLSSSTAQDNLSWRIQEKDDLLPLLDEINSPDPPLFTTMKRADGTYEIVDYSFKSLFNAANLLDGNSLLASDDKLGTIYLMKVRNGGVCGFELYLYNWGATDAIACGYQKDDDGCFGSLCTLYDTALESCRHIQISDRGKKAIRSYLSEKIPQSCEIFADDIPF